MPRQRWIVTCLSLIAAFVSNVAFPPSPRNSAALLAGDGGGAALSWVLGNCNMDRRVDISDAINALELLFLDDRRHLCAPLCDVNGDGELSISDPIAIIDLLFRGEAFRGQLPAREEICDGIDNTCDGVIDEGCPPEGETAVQLAWDSVTQDITGGFEDVAGYQVHFGTSSRKYSNVRDAGNTTKYKVSGLVPGTLYYFAVTAYDRAGNVSDYSNEISVLAGP